MPRSPRLRDAFADPENGPALTQSLKVRPDLGHLLRRIQSPLLGRYLASMLRAVSLILGARARSRGSSAWLSQSYQQMNVARSDCIESDRWEDIKCLPLRASFLFSLDVSRASGRSGTARKLLALPPAASCPYMPPWMPSARDNEVLEIMRHERIVSRRRVHFDDPPASQGGAHGVVALAGAKKRDGHGLATGICHGGTAAQAFLLTDHEQKQMAGTKARLRASSTRYAQPRLRRLHFNRNAVRALYQRQASPKASARHAAAGAVIASSLLTSSSPFGNPATFSSFSVPSSIRAMIRSTPRKRISLFSRMSAHSLSISSRM
jgi:hypothetical protein